MNTGIVLDYSGLLRALDFRPHGVTSSFKAETVKDDLFIRSDLVSRYKEEL